MSDRLTNLVTIAVLGAMGYRLVAGARTSRTVEGRLLAGEIVRGVRWRHVWPVPLVLVTVLVAATTLIVYVPGLAWGWWTALGGEGNPVFGSSSTTAGTLWEWLLPAVFVCLLLPALPLFAYAEERMFRAGAEDWSRPRRALKVLQFGMVHAIIGIPIGAALALSIGGGYFMWVYLHRFRATGSRREATLESARAHTVYNAVIIVLVVVAIVIDALL